MQPPLARREQVMSIHSKRQRCRYSSGVRTIWPALLATVSMLSISSSLASAATDGLQAAAPATDTSNAVLLRKREAMEQRIKTLEGELKHRNDTAEAGSGKPKQAAEP